MAVRNGAKGEVPFGLLSVEAGLLGVDGGGVGRWWAEESHKNEPRWGEIVPRGPAHHPVTPPPIPTQLTCAPPNQP